MLNASHHYDEFSFNPCFSGCRSATVIASVTVTTVMSFNPCFSGCRSATSRCYFPIRYVPTSVSILVLVDAALRHQLEYIDTLDLVDGFNPCFSGCRSAT